MLKRLVAFVTQKVYLQSSMVLERLNERCSEKKFKILNYFKIEFKIDLSMDKTQPIEKGKEDIQKLGRVWYGKFGTKPNRSFLVYVEVQCLIVVMQPYKTQDYHTDLCHFLFNQA